VTEPISPSGTGSASPLISVVLPAHNEEAGISGAIDVIGRTLDECGVSWEIVVVDDGSRDQTFAAISSRAAKDSRIRGIHFSRNFGKEAALLAGINAARGDAVITMDADLQHPPSVIPRMLEAWRAGAKVVHGVKRQREHDSAVMRIRAWVFNKTLTWLGGINVQNSSDFKLMDRVVVDVIARQLPEKRRFFRGLADWVGYRNVEIPFDVAERSDGEGKWSLLGLVELALTALVSFTSAPLRIVTIMGLLTLALGLGITVDTLWAWLHGRAVSGFATTILTLLIIGSFIMISLGIIGEYIAKIYEEVKARPMYLIDESVGFDEGSLHHVPINMGTPSTRSKS
jgi:glycosyltransferase involved in cell wall biosynthesis